MPRAALTVAEVFRRGIPSGPRSGPPSRGAQPRAPSSNAAPLPSAATSSSVTTAVAARRYNSCRNRHCPTCQSLARATWLERRRADLGSHRYFHVVFTVPPAIAEVATQQGRRLRLLFRAVAETLRTIAADPRHLGAEIGFFAVLGHLGPDARPSSPSALRDPGSVRQSAGLPAVPDSPVALEATSVGFFSRRCPTPSSRAAALRRQRYSPSRRPARSFAEHLAGPRDRIGWSMRRTLRRRRAGRRGTSAVHPPDRHQQQRLAASTTDPCASATPTFRRAVASSRRP